MRKHEDKVAVNLAIDELKREFERIKAAREPALLMFGASGLGTTAADRYLWPFNTASTANAAEQLIQAPRSGTIRSLSVYVPDEGTAAADRTCEIVLRKRGFDTPVKAKFTIPKFKGVTRGANQAAVKVERDDLLSVVVRKSGTLTASPGTTIVLVEIE